MDDSWFWEPEDKTSSSSSKKGDNESPTASDLTNVPLEAGGDNEQIDKLIRQLNEKEQRLKKVTIENALLNEKVSQLATENKDLNGNLEELDRQNSAAINELLTIKNSQVEKFNQLQTDFEANNSQLRAVLEEKEKSLLSLQQEYDEMKNSLTEIRQKHDKLEASYIAAMDVDVKQKSEIEMMRNELEKCVVDNVELKALFEVKEKKLQEKLSQAVLNTNKLEEEIEQVKQNKDSDLDRNSNFYERIKNLEDEITAVCIENSKFKDDYEAACREKEEMFEELCERKRTLDEFTEKFESDMIDLKDKVKYMEELEEENLKLQQQIDSLKRPAKEKQAQLQEGHGSTNLTFEEMKRQIKKHFNFESDLANEKDYFDEFLESTKDITTKLKTIEQQLSEAIHELDEYKDQVVTLEAEKDALKSDLLNYEVECSELVKNNDILVMEVETLKSTKLETIPEQNEDIEILEQQLEDSNTLNKNLEDDYKILHKQLDSQETEKSVLQQTIDRLNEQIRGHECKQRNLELFIEGLENEKSNLLFEINELKAGSSTSSNIDVNEKIQELEDQIHIMNRDNQMLLKKVEQLQEELLQSGSKAGELESQLATSQNLDAGHVNEVTELRDRVAHLQHELKQSVQSSIECRMQYENEADALQTKLAEVQAESTSKLMQLQQELEQQQRQITASVVEVDRENALIASATQTDSVQNFEMTVNDLQRQLNEIQTNNRELQEIVSQQQQTIATINDEKNDLIAQLNAKHQEIGGWQAEVQRLNQLLTVEIEKSQQFAHHLDEFQKQQQSRSQSETEKINDQMHFLREKADILTANLMTEQNNLKMLQQEKAELVEKNNALAKDLDRLTKHLLETEEAHTQETMELQKALDEARVKTVAMEEQVKYSNSAYTSAK